VLEALKMNESVRGPGRLTEKLHKTIPINIQKIGAKIPSIAFSLAVSADARKISFLSRLSTSRPTISANFSLASVRLLFLDLLSGTKLITSKTLLRRLLDARVLANPIIKKVTPKYLINIFSNNIVLSIENPIKPLMLTIEIVINIPPMPKAILLSLAIDSIK
tara:strand:+ start:739 stop:1227 length:489 start_codon:yes stop_codon:yes gene_type:complete